MALGKNIKEFRVKKGLSQDKLSELTGWTEENPKLGVSQGAITALEVRDSATSKHAQALAMALGVSLHELLSGEKEPESLKRQVISVRPEDSPSGGYVRLEHLMVEGSCGFGKVNCWQEEVGLLDVSEAWLATTMRVPHKSIRIINARGDSMNPNIKDGDLIFVDVSTQSYVGSGVYVMIWINDPDGLCVIKRLERTPSGKLRVFQDNVNVGYTTSYETDGSDIKIVGQVKAAWQLAVF